MKFRDAPIKQKLIRVILMTCAIILVVSGLSSVVFDLISFRKTNVRHLAAVGKIVSANSTAALAFDSKEEADEILSSLISEDRIKVAYLYDSDGQLFSYYQVEGHSINIKDIDTTREFTFQGAYLIGVEPVIQGDRKLGTLYIASDIRAVLLDRLKKFGIRSIIILLVSLLVAYFLSRWLQTQISRPILNLTNTARSISHDGDYTVRASKMSNDEIGLLTDAFNQMLTEIQAQNQAIAENEARLRAVLDSSLTAVVLVDLQGNVVEWNEMAEKMFGWDKDDVFGEDLSSLIVPYRYKNVFDRGLKEYQLTGESEILHKPTESIALKRDGSEFPVEFSISTIKVNGVDIFCGFITDIAERKHAEKRIHTQLARLSLLSDITRAIGDRLDLTSIFQVVIQRLEDHLPVDFAGIGLLDEIHENVVIKSIGQKSLKLLNNSFEAGPSSVNIEANNFTKCLEGVLIYESDITQSPSSFLKKLTKAGISSLVVAPLKIDDHVQGMLFAARKKEGFTSMDTEFLHQLSEHVSLAVHQTKLHNDLQRAYDDLRQTQQSIMQQERLRALGQMSSGIAHDINNAISPISLYTETLLSTEAGLTENGRKYLGIIQQAIEDVSETVSRMREFYRKREPQINLSEVDLNKLVQQVIDLTRAKWSNMPQQKGVVVNTNSELLPGLPPVLGIESELREALTNLVFNAVDAMPNGGSLTIRTNIMEKQFTPQKTQFGKFIMIEISDTGVGMDEETRRKCLEPFYTTKGERGTGLGLAMVYGAIKRHNADMEVESEQGKGTTVRLVFEMNTSKTFKSNGRGRVNMIPGRKRILIVDDDPLLLDSLKDSLKSDGHVVITASGGEDGITNFRASQSAREKFDLVLTDLGMPYTDGRKVASVVKEISPGTPVILLTGWGQRLQEEGDIPPFVDRVLSKPPKLRELREAIYDLTENKQTKPKGDENQGT